jgi:hypothetical protein
VAAKNNSRGAGPSPPEAIWGSPTPAPPSSSRLAQHEILQDECSFAAWKRSTARSASQIPVVGFRAALDFDHLIERTAVRACEGMNEGGVPPAMTRTPITQYRLSIIQSTRAAALPQLSHDCRTAIHSTGELRFVHRLEALSKAPRLGPFFLGLLSIGNCHSIVGDSPKCRSHHWHDTERTNAENVALQEALPVNLLSHRRSKVDHPPYGQERWCAKMHVYDSVGRSGAGSAAKRDVA